MHIDIWSPGHLVGTNKDTIQLINLICDLTQFVISSVLQNINAGIIANTFMEEVYLSFGMTALIVVDADSKFWSDFEDMCKALKIHLWRLAQGNHIGLLVEKYHRFLKKTQTIVCQYRGTHLSILKMPKLPNMLGISAPIDNTDISLSLSAVGREFRFPLDIKLSALTELKDGYNSTLHNYLRNLSLYAAFATSIVPVIVEERQEAHR